MKMRALPPAIIAAIAVMALTLLTHLVLSGALWAALGLHAAFAVMLVVALDKYRTAKRNAARDNDVKLDSARLIATYEQSGLGWFWQTDRRGNLTYLSEHVAESLGKSPEALIGRPFVELVAAYANDETNHEERTLGFHLSSHTPFSELTICVTSEKDRWWSVSGTPQTDRLGNFSGFCGSGTDLTEITKSREAVTQLARYDHLTKLLNRTSMTEVLERALRTRNGQSPNCSVMLLDLDKFKQVNDTLGHPVGDALLMEVANRLTQAVGSSGQVGRQGGDEFQIIFPDITAQSELHQIADTIIKEISRPYWLHGTQVRIGVSVGVMIVDSSNLKPSSIIRNADLALYEAKDAGRGVARFYDKTMLTRAADRREMEEELREALQRGELSLVYQPVVEVATEALAGFEVLTRWHHPKKGSVSPSKFIEVAEDNGLIEAIGDWTLRQACSQLAKWGRDDLKIAVNVSPRQFRSGNLPALIMNALASTGVHPRQLELEITESVFLEGDEENIAIFNRLKKIGVRLALDDFGTGYSALGYLQKAPFDKIKIDQSFVRGATMKNSINAAIISSIVTLANDLDMDTTAEGAETHDELDLVRDLGCSHVQGYIYSKPLNAEEASDLVKQPRLEASGYRSTREPRSKILQNVGVHHDGYCYGAKVKNISNNGALIDGLHDVPPGTQLLVEFGKGYFLESEARWSQDSLTGLQFKESVNRDRVRNARGTAIKTGWRNDGEGQRQAS